MAVDYQRYVDRVDDLITERPGSVILAFLLLTGVFALGLGNVSTEAGTEQFSQDVPEQNAFEAVNQEFTPSFGENTGSTQLIQSGENVLSRQSLRRMLLAQERLEDRDELRVTSTSSAASIVAQQLDPDATTSEAQRRAVEAATATEIDRAVRRAADRNPRFTGLLSNDFNRQSASASATIGVVTHDISANVGAVAGQGGSSPLTPIQFETARVVDSVGGDIQVFGSGIISAEFAAVIGDTLKIVVPAAVLLISVFLLVAYRDIADLLLGIVSLFMALVWTFGFMGLAGIPFSQILITIPPLMLAIGIDFGIHAVNRYREERVDGVGIDDAMRTATDQVLVAFFIVMGTTVIGFSANLSSQLVPIKQFGVTASIGIVFTFLIFGIFLPAGKVKLDHAREHYPIPTFSTAPFGTNGSGIETLQTAGVRIARGAPVVFVVVLVVGSGFCAVYATGVDTSFGTEDFLPPEEPPEYYDYAPKQLEPGDYTVTSTLNFLENHFESGQDDAVTVYIEGPLARDTALESIYRAGDDPPGSFVRTDGRADSTSIVTVIQDHANRDASFERLVERNDADDNGVPDQNLDEIYDALLASSARGQALQYMTEDRRSSRVVYTVEADASQQAITDDAWVVADRHRFKATPTGGTVVFQAITELIFNSAIVSLTVALGGTAIFLVLIYGLLLGRPSLGLANLIPVAMTVTAIAGTMRVLGISFNAFTATILAITIGLGIDYSVHITHRFADEYEELDREVYEALEDTVRGTGGALTGSMLTTVFGIGVLVISLFPAIGQFGLLTALSVFYAYLASIYILPSVLVVWARLAPEGW